MTKNNKLIPPLTLNQAANTKDGNTLITTRDMAVYTWNEGRHQFVAPRQAENKNYELRNDYNLFLAQMTVEQRLQYWHDILMQLPHSASASFVDDPELYNILDQRVREALANTDIARHMRETSHRAITTKMDDSK